MTFWERCCSWGRSMFGWLNGIGALILGFALVNPDARQLFGGALDLLPEPWRSIAGIVLSMAWLSVVQAAHRREVKKAIKEVSA